MSKVLTVNLQNFVRAINKENLYAVQSFAWGNPKKAVEHGKYSLSLMETFCQKKEMKSYCRGFMRDIYKFIIFAEIRLDNIDEAKKYLLKNEWWRIVKLDLSNSDNIVDWTHEREWRVPKEIVFEYSQCEIILPTSKYYRRFVQYCLGNDREDILLKIRGIVVMSSVYF